MSISLEDYALIGNCETAALVSRNGSIDWLCVPRFDSAACFAALLGSSENGCWQMAPRVKSRVTRRYLPDTLILETTFHTPRGTATMTDFMPLGTAAPKIIRVIRGRTGSVAMAMSLVIRFDYGLTVPWVTRGKGGNLLAIAGPHRLILHSSVPVHGERLKTVSDFIVKAGDIVQFELQYGNSIQPTVSRSNPRNSLKKTAKTWRKWVSRCKYQGPWQKIVTRSLITLKALTYAPTGGIVAAPTTSLPESPHGRLNWDYRYCWVRDATYALLGFLHAGFTEEASQWKDWLVRSVAGSATQVQVLYGPAGERLLSEWTVPWLAGYRGASPVRVGNAASEQLQLDLYGELADVLHLSRASDTIKPNDFELQRNLMEHLAKIWKHPDRGIWEIRGKSQQFTHSKVMTWVAFDRSIRSAEKFGFKAPLAEWRAIRSQIHADICRLGFNSRLKSFVQSYGSREVDASLLLIPLVGFLPPDDWRIVGTVRRIEKKLIRGGFVMRNIGLVSDAKEGAFLPCSFWLADYYCLVGRTTEAKRLLHRLLKVRNDVGLLAEEYYVERKKMVGNFPQALSHVALVNTVLSLYGRHSPVHHRLGLNSAISI